MSREFEKAFISFRIGVYQWLVEERFRELLGIFDNYRGVTDEVTFFTSETHPPLPIDIIKKHAGILSERMPQVRKRGLSAGINVLSTIGHHNENLPNSLSGDYTHMTDIDGNVCLGSFCPNDDNMRRYVAQLYEIIAMADPDYIWIDDDVRLYGHMPILCGCFCDNCLAIFKEESGEGFTRESLKKAFSSGSAKMKLETRKAWLQHNRNTIARLLKLAEKTVHSLKSCMPLGFMSGERFFEGYDFDNWSEILSGQGNVPVMWRPGGGFYSDECIKELVTKSHDIGRQVSLLPDSIISIQSEIENFPYQRLKKSAHVTALEAASHIAAGCTGTAFNVLSGLDEPFDEYLPLVAGLKEARPFYDLMVRAFGRSKPAGIFTGWNKDSFSAINLMQGDWLGEDADSAGGPHPNELGGAHACELFEIGLPPSYSLDYAAVTALSGSSVLAMNEDEIRKILSSGVYMDIQALEHLNEMGYEELTGFQVEKCYMEDCIEIFTEHPINRSFAGRRRDCRQSFWWKRPAGAIRPTKENAQILARMDDYKGKKVAECCLGIFDNRIGGRICVAGYYPWMLLQSLSKSSQLKSIFLWLSSGKLPAYVDSYHKVNIWVRESVEYGPVLAVINGNLDPVENLAFMLRTDMKEISVFDMNCAEMRVASCYSEASYRKFILPFLKPWEIKLVIPARQTIKTDNTNNIYNIDNIERNSAI